MRYPYGNLSLAANAQYFIVRLEHLARLITHMAEVSAVAGSSHLRQANHFFGGGEVALFVFKPRRKAKRAVQHFLLKQGFHAYLFGRSGGAVKIFAHHLHTQRGVAGEAGHVDGWRRGLQLGPVSAEGKHGFTILPDHHRSYALPRHGCRVEIVEQTDIRMRMRIDETGR